MPLGSTAEVQIGGPRRVKFWPNVLLLRLSRVITDGLGYFLVKKISERDVHSLWETPPDNFTKEITGKITWHTENVMYDCIIHIITYTNQYKYLSISRAASSVGWNFYDVRR